MARKKMVQIANNPAFEPMKLTFDQWWNRNSTKRKFSAGLKEALRLHFEKWGFMKDKEFDKGLKHFGY